MTGIRGPAMLFRLIASLTLILAAAAARSTLPAGQRGIRAGDPRLEPLEEESLASTETAVSTVDEVTAQLAAVEDPGMRAVNERHGGSHGVKLTKLRVVASN